MIIFLNGASSVGKSSIARQIMHLSHRPFIYFSIDHLVNFWMDEKFVAFESDDKDWFYQESSRDEEGNLVTKIVDGPNAVQLHWDMIESLGVLIKKGYDIIIDEVLWDKEIFERYAHQLCHANSVFLIKITCDLIECEKREGARADRFKGLARALFSQIDSTQHYYDLQIDTTYTSAQLCAQQIIDAVELSGLTPKAFSKSLCEMISFKPIEDENFPLLFKWLNTPHVKLWWGDEQCDSLEATEKKYASYVLGYKESQGQNKKISAFIIYCAFEPIGYIQYYNAYDFPRTGYQLMSNIKLLSAIDTYIGEPHYVKKGIGASMIDQFLKATVWNHFDGCFVDPDVSNDYAIRVYEKAGFKTIKRLENPHVQWMLRKKEKRE